MSNNIKDKQIGPKHSNNLDEDKNEHHKERIQLGNSDSKDLQQNLLAKTNLLKNKEMNNFSTKIAFLNSFAMFESAAISNEGQLMKSNNCMPSKLKDFHKEKLENICMNKVRDQMKYKDNPSSSFLNHEFQKNNKTGEYQISKDAADQLKKETRLENLGNNKVKMMIQRFENINQQDDNILLNSKDRNGVKNQFK